MRVSVGPFGKRKCWLKWTEIFYLGPTVVNLNHVFDLTLTSKVKLTSVVCFLKHIGFADWMFHIIYNKIMSKNVLEQDPSEEHPILRSQSAIPEENFQISDSSI